MEAEVLKTVGQIAGIGGISLGVFLLLFRDIIRKKNSHNSLNNKHFVYSFSFLYWFGLWPWLA